MAIEVREERFERAKGAPNPKRIVNDLGPDHGTATAGREACPRDRHGILRVFGSEIQRLDEPERTSWLKRADAYWKARGFPYPVLTEQELARGYRVLERTKPGDVLHRNELSASTVGLRVANAFHPQMWSVPIRGHTTSPVENFADDSIRRSLLGRAARFWPKRRCWNAQNVRSLLRVYRGGRAANFRPAVARALLARLGRAQAHVLDFSAGYGGRLLGALTLPCHYVGIDPDRRQVAGLRAMISATAQMAAGTAAIHRGCAEDLLPSWPEASVDVILSSPPYFDVEKYSAEPDQSYVRYPTYPRWIEGFLRPVLRQAYRILKPGGHLALNVADVARYPLAQDAKAIGRSLFGRYRTIRMLMSAMPVQRSAGESSFRFEPILIFRKRQGGAA